MSQLGDPIGIGRTAEIYAWRPGEVIKLLRPGFPDAIGEREATVAEIVTRAGLAAPRFHGVERIDGRLGLVYERVDGPSMLDVMARRPWRIGGLAVTFARLHAAMHGTNATGLTDHKDYLRLMIGRAGDRLSGEARQAALDRLAGLPDGDAVCHGDMHPGNVLMTGQGLVVIDWLTASRGSPAADVARTMFLLEESAIPGVMPRLQRAVMGRARRRFAASYLRSYAKLAPFSNDEVAAWRLPMLAARLGEGIDVEQPALRARIDFELADHGRSDSF